MHAKLLSILLKAAQALRQVFQLNRQRTAGAATAGKAQVMRILGITGKLAFTAGKRREYICSLNNAAALCRTG